MALAGVALAAGVAAGYGEQDHYLTHRYEDTGQAQDLANALRWSRDVRDARIAVAGIRAVFTQYPFYGTDLSNRVQWLGVRGPHDSYQRIPNCPQWRRAINAGGFTHVVTTFDPYLPDDLHNSPEGRWTQSDPNAHVVLRDGPVRVFELRGPLDPAGCRGPKTAHPGPASQRSQPQRDPVEGRLRRGSRGRVAHAGRTRPRRRCPAPAAPPRPRAARAPAPPAPRAARARRADPPSVRIGHAPRTRWAIRAAIPIHRADAYDF